MWPKVLTLVALLISTFAQDGPDFDVTVSKGVRSMGYKVVYGDDDLTIINDVVNDFEKSSLKNKLDLNEAIPPLPALDVKCLMSVDRYCSKNMMQMKGVLIRAIKDGCGECTIKQKEEAGHVIASMMAHDPVAWKLFLTRSAIQSKPPRLPDKEEILKFRVTSEPEEIENSRNRYIFPGAKVRVKRYNMERLP